MPAVGSVAEVPEEGSERLGLAVDVAPDADAGKPGLQPDYAPALYATLERLAPTFGLTTGASYGDRPHVEIPGYVRAPDLAPLRRQYEACAGTEAQKLRAAWRVLEIHPPAAWAK